MNAEQAKELKYNDRITVTFSHGGSVEGRFESYSRGYIYYSSTHSPPGQHARVGLVETGWLKS